MSVTNLEVIDLISINLNGDAVLTITDHLEWDTGDSHLLVLQNKINAYLEFVENGNLYQNYPNASGRKIIIEIIVKYEPPPSDKNIANFLHKTEDILRSAGYGFEFRVLTKK